MNCPKCGDPGTQVFLDTVYNLLKEDLKAFFEKGVYYACTNPDCEVAYFGGNTYLVSDVYPKLWYKDSSDDVYLCYCNKVTRREIKEAFQKVGPDLKAIFALTGACGGGRCRTENPLGRCCHKVIEEYVKELRQQ
ncbi:copper chaperone Copz family protein [Carboxydothermus pertinax]|uniref:(2Fe-2S)-binding protein n=1 Tax=Carboxydothermus pertinax TaxID=870242 RepID=A0A1L8CUZ5_9THEO|nr:copper chaperone Copz family protein [Carboxydothermus pertinax]GAV22733.1 (2Fe-2S)-binding protein [Carboxydothermus pertinax]